MQFSSDVAFSPGVKREQERRGSRAAYARLEQRGGFETRITPKLAAFLSERRSVYLATASADGRPYVQHRGGPPGFLRVLDDRTLAFADFQGNRQYISLGNLAENDRVALIATDYANRRRVKLWGRARVVDADPALLERLDDPAYASRPERVLVIEIEAWDRNCPQHIPRLLDEAAAARLEARIEQLERENAALLAGRSRSD